jgi:hypothetical protein
MSSTNKKAYVYEMAMIPANIFAMILFILASIVTYKIFGYTGFMDTPFILIIIIGYFCLHEFMHGVGYYLGGCKKENIAFGVLLEKGIFYCMGYQELTKKNILLSLQMPFTVLSVIPYFIGVFFHLSVLSWLAVINFMGAAMDMAMFFYVLGIKNVHYSEAGPPNQFVLISNEDLTKRKNIFFHIKEVKDYKKEDYVFKDIKRFQYTKLSFIILVVVIAIDLLTVLGW